MPKEITATEIIMRTEEFNATHRLKAFDELFIRLADVTFDTMYRWDHLMFWREWDGYQRSGEIFNMKIKVGQ